MKPFQINNELAPLIEQESNAPLNVKHPVQVLSVMVGETFAHLGISLVQQNLSDWGGGVRRFAKEKGQISRAEFKLLEAIEQFGLELPARSRALDLGAAPGAGIMTLKLPTTTPLKPLNHALNILEEAFTVAQTRQLFHNRNEVTVYLRKKQV